MRKFKVGDIIIGNPSRSRIYPVTTDMAVMKVVKIMENRFCDIKVEILKHYKNPCVIGMRFDVHSPRFDLFGDDFEGTVS